MEEIRELDTKIASLQSEVNNLIKRKSDLHREWQNKCTHPEEYMKEYNKYYEDDYGATKQRDPKNYKYSCSACGKQDIKRN
jgi:hypothetical protein